MYSALKKKWEDSIACVIEEREDIQKESCVSSMQRSQKFISDLVKDIEEAIQERQRINNDLEKLVEESVVLFRKGELLVDKKCHQSALRQFSKSICCIPYDVHIRSRAFNDHRELYSETGAITFSCDKKAKIPIASCRLALIQSYAARAEVLRILGHHELALKDIEEALAYRPEATLRSSILRTHKLCLSEMKRFQRACTSRKIPDVAHGHHATVSSASDLLRVNYSEGKGRYMEANGVIKAGDVLIAEKPYASVLLPEFYATHCYHCIKPLVAPIPCFMCKDVLFCSKLCQETSFSSYHCIECKLWPLIQTVDSFAHLSIKVLLTAKSEELLGALGNEKNSANCTSNQIHGLTDEQYKHNYKAVYNLVTNSNLQSEESNNSNNMVSQLISRFLASPRSSASISSSADEIARNRKKGRSGIRLSSSSPALLDTNLNSLADAFANQHNKENGDINIQNQAETERRCSMPMDALKLNTTDNQAASKHRRTFSDLEIHSLSLFEKTVLTEDQIQVLILRHLQQIACNVHMVTTLHVVEDDSCDVSRSESSHCKEEYTMRKEQRQIALALYPTACLLNHACDPDVIVSFQDGCLIIRATHNISPGEEITHCYMPHVGKMLRAARQKMLQKRYFFICHCSACKRDEERERRQLCSLKLICPSCRDVVEVDYTNDSYVGTCCNVDCRQVSNVESQLQEIQKCRELFLDAVDLFKDGNIKKSLCTLQLVLKKRSAVLTSKDKLIAEVHDALSRCYEVLREWELASYYCSLNLDAVEHQYGATSSECAHAVNKLAHFLFNGKLYNKVVTVIDRGIKLMSLHYGGEYHAVKVLLKMKECVRNCSSPVSQFAI